MSSPQDSSSFAPSTNEVLHDLVHERGLRDWRVVHGAECAAIFGRVRVEHFDETRASRKRKLPARRELAPARGDDDDGSSEGQGDDEDVSAACCFLVVPTTGGRQLSVRRLAELEQSARTLAPEGAPHCDRTFLCLTDAANVSYYRLTRDPLASQHNSR